MTEKERNLIITTISDEINAVGFVKVKELTLLLENHLKKHGITRALYSQQGPKRWLKAYFPEFEVVGDSGKEIIIFPNSVDSADARFSDLETLVIEEERISYNALSSSTDDNSDESTYRVGVVDFCNNKNAFINYGYENSKVARAGLSVRFNPTLAETLPERSVFDTKNFVYLVCYATSGTARNPKTGLDHPALDYSTPIKIIRALPIKQCAYIRISSEEVIVGHVVATDVAISLERAVIAIDAFLRNELAKNSYVLSAYFPKIAEKCGLPNFRRYADSVELFLEKYLPEYELKKNIAIQGKLYPGIIVLKGETPAEIETTEDSAISAAKVIIPDMSFAVLDELFESGKYADYLASDIMKKIQPQELPREYLEKALTCAHRLIYPESLERVSLNPFQQELVSNPTTAMFIKKWKIHGVFSEDIVTQCGDTAIAHFDYPEHNALVVKLLNAIGTEKTLNNNYVGITARFVACENVLIPHFYIIRAFVQNSKASIQKIVSEYCQIVKDMRHSTSGPRMPDDLRMCSFEAVLRIIHNNIFDCSQLAQNIRTNIASVFVEYDQMRVLQEIIPLWDIEGSSVEWRLVDLYFNLGGWTEQRFMQLLNDGVNRELLQRCLALQWREAYHDNILNKNYLNLLSWVILHDDYSSIDEVIRYSSGKGLSRSDKQNMLINSFETVCNYAVDNDKMYVLASYIIFVIRANIDSNNATTDATEKLDSWNKFSNSFYTQKIKNLNCLTPETESQLVDLFIVFCMDFPNYLKLQTHYAEWFVRTCPPADLSIENIDTVFEELYRKGAYSAFVEYYSLDSWLELEEIRKRHAGQYIESLIHLHRYTDAISFLWASQSLDASERNVLLVRAIGENFRENGISPKAFSCIGDASMRNEAVKMLLAEFKPTQPLIINSLIALYVYEKKYMHAAYLFTIFGLKVDKGFVRLYSQIRSQLGKYVDFNKLKSQHHVIAYAFQTLKTDALIDFLNWASRITIPNYKDHREGHVFSFYYDNIIANATSEDAWVSFLNHLVKNGLERNAWNICVCEAVLRKVLNYQDSNYSQGALEYILSSNNTALYPPNFVVYAFEIIRDSQSVSLCRRFVDALNNKDLYQRVITSNAWLNAYEDNVKAFKYYCQNTYRTSGNPAFQEALSLLETELSLSELKALVQSATGKQALFSRICYNYLNDCDAHETMEILFSEDWVGLTENEYSLLGILRLIYSHDDVLLLDPDGLFDDEESVGRFKRDCAEIISAYPEKNGLFAFDKACMNESYKTLVYSYIFDVLYDQDIYKSLDKCFTELTNPKAYKTYLRLLSCAYKVQTIRNTTFPFFYKKWRYLKWYLALVLQYSTNADDSDILSQMEKNGHYDDIYADSYAPFTETVKQFMELDGLSPIFKNHFLFALMVSHVEDLYDTYAKTLSEMPAHHKSVCRKLIQIVDYRYFNTSLFVYLWKDIKEGDFSRALPLAEAVSDYAFDTMVALKANFSDATKSMFKQLISVQKNAQLLSEVIALDASEIDKHHSWIIPLLCSRQFDFLINDRFRSLVITQRNDLVCRKYKYVSDYLVQKGKAKGIYSYLCALLACIKNDAGKARYITEGVDVYSLVPKQWLQEAGQIVKYANGELQNFKPDKSIVDGSEENTNRSIEIVFAEELLRTVFAENASAPSTQEALNIYKNYLETADPWEQSRLGLRVLLWYNNNKHAGNALPIPEITDFALKLGLELLRPEVNLTVENRLLVIAELYKNRQAYSGKTYHERMEDLKAKFIALINTGFALNLWVEYAAIIEDLLREENKVLDFAKLRTRILNKCTIFSSPEISYEEKYERCLDLLNMFAGLTSPYSTGVKLAIEEEKEKLQNGILLNIEIENTETTDHCVYFQIQNKGRRTVSFLKDALTIELQQKDQPSDESIALKHIHELQSGSVSGGKVSLVVTPVDKQISVKLKIYYSAPSGQKELVCATEEDIVIGCACDPYVPIEAITAARNGVSWAVTDDGLLFGRKSEREHLAAWIRNGVTLIYGPSRIGKTSLMNWIRKKHAIDKGNVLTVLIGGEGGAGKGKEYEKNILNKTESVPYDDPEKMSQYLLVDTIIYGLTESLHLGLPSKVELSDDFIDGILKDLNEATTITAKYARMNRRLEKAGVELWLLLDEFQEVVERWKNMPSWCAFVEICNILSGPEREKLNNIKTVFCGSDDLLTHMTVKHDSVWKNLFRYTVPVSALGSKDFEEMIRKDQAISYTNLSFSQTAIEALYNYTGGVALYGKEICRAIFEEISENPPKWASRKTIYTADIAETTQRLLNRQRHELSTQAQEGISSIYKAVTKNLKEDTDKQLLWYMAMWINKNSEQDGFAESNFTSKPMSLEFKSYLNDFLEIVIARGIIKKNLSQYTGENIYAFKTLFYYYAFCGSAPRDILQNNNIYLRKDTAEEPEDLATNDPYDFSSIIQIAPKFKERYTSEQQCAFLGALAFSGDIKVRDALRELAGTNIGTQNNVQVNIANTLNGILVAGTDAAKIISSLQSLPRLDAYLGEDKTLLLRNLESDDPGLVMEAETKLESSTTKMVADYLAALISQNDVPEGFCIWEQLGTTKLKYDALTKTLEPSFVAELILAAKLDHIFGLAEKGQERSSSIQDYSPVSIMYCKVLEKMLKHYHTDIYISRFPYTSTEVKDGGDKIKFGKLSDMETQRRTWIQNMILLGAFLYPINPSYVAEDRWLTIGNNDEEQAVKWETHGHMLSRIKEIRNSSAHGAEGIVVDKDILLELKTLLFSNDGLKRVIDLH